MKQTQTVVAIRDMSVSDGTIGEAWQETKIFGSHEPIENILKWAMKDSETFSKKRITITVPRGKEVV